jgi:hypothetical protein
VGLVRRVSPRQSFLTRRNNRTAARHAGVIREYALERLAETASRMRAASVRALLSRARTTADCPSRPDQAVGGDALRGHDNLRGRSVVARDGAGRVGNELGGALVWFWYVRAYTEGRRWLAFHKGPNSPPVRAKAQAGRAFSFLQCDYAGATALLEAAKSAFEALDDKRQLVARPRRAAGRSSSASPSREPGYANASAIFVVPKSNISGLACSGTRHSASHQISAFRARRCEGTAWSLLNLRWPPTTRATAPGSACPSVS